MESHTLNYKLLRVAADIGNPSVSGVPYESAIHDHASQGYDLVQIFIENPAAVPREYVLIFKRAQGA